MGTEFIRKAAKTFKKSWDWRRVELATANLFTQQPCSAARTAEADLVGNARLQPGEVVTIQTTESGLIAIRDLTVVAHFRKPSADLIVAVRSSCGIAKGIVEQIHPLAGIAEISVC